MPWRGPERRPQLHRPARGPLPVRFTLTHRLTPIHRGQDGDARIGGMKATPFVIDWPAPGRLGVMVCPAGGERLADDLAALREEGVDTLVSALSDHERRWLNLALQSALS